jgi:hypothetical protein
MKTIVRIYGQKSLDEDKLLGEIELNGDKLRWSKPMDDKSAMELITEPIECVKDGKQSFIRHEDAPEEWIENLQHRFNGTTIKASEPMYVTDSGDILKKIGKEDEANLEKALSSDGIGNFSIQDTGFQPEINNNNGVPVKVNAFEEQKSKTPVENGDGKYFERAIMKSVINEWFYKNDGVNNSALADLKLKMIDVAKGNEEAITPLFGQIVNIFRKSSGFEAKIKTEELLK